MNKQYRQGDVLLELVGTIPDSAKPVKEQIIAHGETSNHCHRVTDGVEVLEAAGEKFLQVSKDGKLEHVLVSSPATWTGEHHPIELPPGKYRVIQQQEYDPYEQHIRQVQD
jgi:hypothetical protein